MVMKVNVQKQSSKQLLPKVNSEAFFKIGVLKNFATEKPPVLESLSNKVAGLKAGNFIKKKLQHRCFPVNIAKNFKNSLFYRTSPVAVFASLMK